MRHRLPVPAWVPFVRIFVSIGSCCTSKGIVSPDRICLDGLRIAWTAEHQRLPAGAHDSIGDGRVQRVVRRRLELRYRLFYVQWKPTTTDELGPHRDRRSLNRLIRQSDVFEIVVQVWPSTAVGCVAGRPDPGSTVSPAAHSADVLVSLVRQEHIGTPIELLRPSLQPPGMRSDRSQVCVIGHNEEQVDVLRIRSISHNRTEETDRPHTRNLAGCPEEVPSRFKELPSMARACRSWHCSLGSETLRLRPSTRQRLPAGAHDTTAPVG